MIMTGTTRALTRATTFRRPIAIITISAAAALCVGLCAHHSLPLVKEDIGFRSVTARRSTPTSSVIRRQLKKKT